MHIANQYPKRGLYDADQLGEEEYLRLLADVKKYYKIFRIFTIILLVMAAAILIRFPSAAVMQIKEVYLEKDKIGLTAIIISLIFEIGIIGMLVYGAYKLFKLSGKQCEAVKNRDFTFSVGTLTDKSRTTVRTENDRSTTTTLYVNNIPCTDLENDYFNSFLGKEYYIIYVCKVRFAMPFDSAQNRNNFENNDPDFLE